MSRLTTSSYRQKVRDLLAYNATPDELSVKEFLSNMRRRGVSSGTIANYVKAFRSFFGYLRDNNLYHLELVKLKLPHVKRRERRVPRDEEIAQLIQALSCSEDAIMFLLFVDCGLRITELATIKLDNIDFSDASIVIKGKNDKVRIVYMSETTLKYLRVYVRALKGEYLFAPTRSDARIAHRSRRYFARRLDKLCARAGVERLSPHQLRHYFATHTLSRGADIKAVSEMLGHADVTITLKIYHHVNARAIRAMHQEYSPISGVTLALPATV